MLAARLDEHDDSPVDDRMVVLHGASWADFQRLLEMRGDVSVPRIAFLQGALQVMTPSRPHESIKSTIGCLLEVWCLAKDIDFSPYGSWTLEQKEMGCGIEPDECYVFGTDPDPVRPDLAIEVVWTSGGIDKLEIYRRLGVREVWFWRRGKLTAYLLRGDLYVEGGDSELLRGLNLGELAQYLDRAPASRAIREYRALLAGR